jgi:hypothetical protein
MYHVVQRDETQRTLVLLTFWTFIIWRTENIKRGEWFKIVNRKKCNTN